MNKIIKNEILTFVNEYTNMESYTQFLKDVKDAKPMILLSNTQKFNNKDFTITWNKPLQKDTLKTLANAIRKENKTGDMLNGLENEEYATTLSMMKALKPLEIKILSKQNKKEFVFKILDTSEEKNTKVTLMYKILFFYSYSYIHKVLKSDD